MAHHRKPSNSQQENIEESSLFRQVLLLCFFVTIFIFGSKIYFENRSSETTYFKNSTTTLAQKNASVDVTDTPIPPLLDTVEYDKKMLQLANLPKLKVITSTTSNATSTAISNHPTSTPIASSPWPVKTVYPNHGALLPFNRIVAYYGNFYSKQMGVLGEYPPDIMLSKLNKEVTIWKQADPTTPVIPAIHYIVAVAQASPGSDGDYLARMPFTEIDKAIDLAKQANGIVFLDIQIANSNVAEEVYAIQKYLALPQVHLGIDPEFAMKDGKKPGTVIGTMDASQINEAAAILAKIVRDNHIPPKILLLHRFTEDMITNYKNIKPLPEVQIVIDMDGWGPSSLKIATYQHVITKEPVQFSGIKLFYKNDLRKPSTGMLTPVEILKLVPQPSYVQYQ